MKLVKTEVRPSTDHFISQIHIGCHGLTKVKSLNVSQFSSACISLAMMLGMALLIILTTPNFLAITAFVVLAVLAPLNYYGFPTATYADDDIHKNLRDQLDKIVESYKAIRKAEKLAPEGLGIKHRSEEFGRLAWDWAKTAEGLKIANVGDATNSHLHAAVNKVSTDGTNLAQTGRELCNLIANRRVDSIASGFEFSGIKEFSDEVSLETQIYRSLNSGEDDASPKVDKTHPCECGLTGRCDWCAKQIWYNMKREQTRILSHKNVYYNEDYWYKKSGVPRPRRTS